jgi:hypothetical protein
MIRPSSLPLGVLWDRPPCLEQYCDPLIHLLILLIVFIGGLQSCFLSKIWDCHNGDCEYDCFLRRDAVGSGTAVLTFQRCLLQYRWTLNIHIPWWWRQQDPLKHYTSNKLHGVTSQKIVILKGLVPPKPLPSLWGSHSCINLWSSGVWHHIVRWIGTYIVKEPGAFILG